MRIILKQDIMKKEIKQIGLFALIVLFFAACNQKFAPTGLVDEFDQEISMKSAKVKVEEPSILYTIDAELPDALVYTDTLNFVAGQNYDAGTVFFAKVADKLYLTIDMNDEWLLELTHVYVGTFESIPLNKSGNPQIGHFPVSDAFKKGTDLVTYEIDLTGMADELVLLVHGDVKSGKQSETAWMKDLDLVDATRWGWFTELVVFVPR